MGLDNWAIEGLGQSQYNKHTVYRAKSMVDIGFPYVIVLEDV